MAETNNVASYKVTWKGWLALIFLIVTFSGALVKAGVWSAFDFQTLTGNFGEIVKGVNFEGKGGTGAREGFIFTLTLIPTVMFALGLIQVAESMGALQAAERLFRPILRPLMGIPGVAGLAFVSSFTSSDVGSVMTKGLFEEKLITDNERTIFVAYQYAASAVVTNTLGAGAAMLPISVLPVGVIIGLLVVIKFFGANIVRIILHQLAKKEEATGGDIHG